MTKQQLINSLVKIGNDLDDENKFEDADSIDSIIKYLRASPDKSIEEIELEIPEDERMVLQQISEALSQSLALDKLSI